jgi:hypothetical protein
MKPKDIYVGVPEPQNFWGFSAIVYIANIKYFLFLRTLEGLGLLVARVIFGKRQIVIAFLFMTI